MKPITATSKLSKLAATVEYRYFKTGLSRIFERGMGKQLGDFARATILFPSLLL